MPEAKEPYILPILRAGVMLSPWFRTIGSAMIAPRGPHTIPAMTVAIMATKTRKMRNKTFKKVSKI